MSCPCPAPSYADFASCGLTRYWMRRGISGNLAWAGLRDTAAGAAIFMALGFATIAAIHDIRPQDGVPLVDLAPIFDGLRDPHQRGSYGAQSRRACRSDIARADHVSLPKG